MGNEIKAEFEKFKDWDFTGKLKNNVFVLIAQIEGVERGIEHEIVFSCSTLRGKKVFVKNFTNDVPKFCYAFPLVIGPSETIFSYNIQIEFKKKLKLKESSVFGTRVIEKYCTLGQETILGVEVTNKSFEFFDLLKKPAGSLKYDLKVFKSIINPDDVRIYLEDLEKKFEKENKTTDTTQNVGKNESLNVKYLKTESLKNYEEDFSVPEMPDIDNIKEFDEFNSPLSIKLQNPKEEKGEHVFTLPENLILPPPKKKQQTKKEIEVKKEEFICSLEDIEDKNFSKVELIDEEEDEWVVVSMKDENEQETKIEQLDDERD